ncbi:MAG: triose-phosphate isomerase [Nitrospirae bacterium]|nr:triose-phosphate isomerase [Nitrospirota bacterium]
MKKNNRRPLIIANWKMNKTIPEALQFVNDLRKKLKEADIADGVDTVLAPPYTALKAVSDSIAGDEYLFVAAQNIFYADKGAYTGEISPAMLVDTGCKYVIIGHSERRQYFGETDETVNKKINAALYYNLTPVFCIGESLQQREQEATFKVIRSQIEGGLSGLSEGALYSIVIAYEPIWAIGTGKTAAPEQAEEVHGFIRAILRETYGSGVSEGARILYGGSVTPENVSKLMKEPDIDGALVGGASLNVDSFVKIVTGSQVNI